MIDLGPPSRELTQGMYTGGVGLGGHLILPPSTSLFGPRRLHLLSSGLFALSTTPGAVDLELLEL